MVFVSDWTFYRSCGYTPENRQYNLGGRYESWVVIRVNLFRTSSRNRIGGGLAIHFVLYPLTAWAFGPVSEAVGWFTTVDQQ
ncbi:hypothetical protein BDV30DRAFT_201923 [Aspergillus minisclerotigenes]|uniref:Uncharacterized protein n=1 Tax=Aspergillus minisclerotigenes TaxID=656917 RepID=A0A5N6JL96_9EURO|nr:hypothetical protein BDV30DRAFT_201923 [Aspergillus minisclerotigenes]